MKKRVCVSEKKRTIIAMAVILSMLMTLCPVMPIAAAETEPVKAAGGSMCPFGDVTGEKCEEAVTVLNAIGILEGKSETEFDPNGKVTRAEMTAIILRLMGLSNSKGEELPFSDVPKTHWAYDTISAAYAMKIVKGFDETTFAPDGTVTYAQAVKMLIVLLGYGEAAEAAGGYPGGYLAKAAQLGILKGLPDLSGDELDRAFVAMLVYKATDAEISVRANFGGDNLRFITVEDATVLSEYLHINKYEDVITANYFTTISAPRSLKQDEVALADKVFHRGTTNAADLIGRKVTVYAKDDESGINDGTILYVKENANVKTLTVDFGDITAATTESKLVYDDSNNKKAYADISGAIMIYNGKLKPVWTREDLLKDAGKLTLVANGGGGYTLMFAYEYKNYAVDGKDNDNMTLRLMPNRNGVNEISVDLSDTSVKKNIKDADGTPITFSDFAKWDVISVAESDDGRVMDITRSRKTVKGKITERSDKEAVIGQTRYTISKLFEDTDDLKLDLEATYYLDCFGELAFADETVKAYKYGYIVSAASTKGLNSHPEIKIFTEDNTMAVYKTMDRVYINGVSVEKGDILSNASSRSDAVKIETAKLFDEDGVKGQMIRYELNEAGELRSIETAMDNTSAGRYTPEFSLDVYKSGNTLYVGRDIASFDCRNILTADTKIFLTPPEYTGYDKDYGMMKSSEMIHGVGNYKDVSIFDVTEDNVVSVVWMASSGGGAGAMSLSTDSTAAIITDITKGYNEEGDLATKLKVFTEEGGEKTLYAEDGIDVYFGQHALTDIGKERQVEEEGNAIVPKEKIEVTDLSCGDVIQYDAVNTRVTGIIVLLRAENPIEGEKVYGSYGEDSHTGLKPAEKNDVYSSRTYGYGRVRSVAATTLVAEFPSPDGTEIFDRAYMIKGQVLRYDTKNHTAQKIGAGDISVGDKIFVSRVTYTQKLIIIFK